MGQERLTPLRLQSATLRASRTLMRVNEDETAFVKKVTVINAPLRAPVVVRSPIHQVPAGRRN